MDELSEFISQRQPVAFLTGAGVSTESGLPDYRGPAGLWRNRRFAELASVRMLTQASAEFWSFYSERLAGLVQAKPSGAHTAIAALESAGLALPVLTQNVDGLHRRAGSLPVELHGSLERTRCTQVGCSEQIGVAETLSRIGQDAEGIPRCDMCGAMLRPGVVLFGEPLPDGVMERAFETVMHSGGIVVCGTSLEVWPVAGLVELAMDCGLDVAIVNLGESAADHLASLRVVAPAGEVLAATAGQLGVLERPER